MKFLVDNQLPAALARFPASRRVDCQHVNDVDLGTASDAAIWEYASQNELIVISKDEDFLYLASISLQCATHMGSIRELPH